MIPDDIIQVNLILRNYADILERIDRAARSVGRESNICLVVVTKGQPLEKVRAVIQAGARNLGENYVDEAVLKMQVLQDKPGIFWHMIGHVQSRKASQVCQHFAWLHSLDSLKLATRLNHFAWENGRKLNVLLECNVSGEETKYGFMAWNEASWEQLLPDVAEIISLPNLEIRGLMTMAPYSQESEDARPFFRRLRHLREYFKSNLPQQKWSELSMGMSMDFEVAIQEGATIVRIGEGILGKRMG